MNKQDNVSIFMQLYKKYHLKTIFCSILKQKRGTKLKFVELTFFHHANCTKENCTTFYLTNRLKGMFKTNLGYAYTFRTQNVLVSTHCFSRLFGYIILFWKAQFQTQICCEKLSFRLRFVLKSSVLDSDLFWKAQFQTQICCEKCSFYSCSRCYCMRQTH